jgi:2-dehydro-3-deoxyphosphogluconate aldolase/(4S)-4-hydroxy-2-oxoglutarate aldolase
VIPKFEHMQRIVKTGVIAVVRAESADEAIKIADAVRKGGIDLIEITFTVPGAIDVMKELAKNFSSDELLLGAGTVLDPETARAALLAGAEYIVSPYFNPEIVKLCNRYQKICMPGCMTVTEIVQAMEAGADIVKFFPGSAFGPSIVKAIKGPLPQAQIIPTGGVSLDNVQEWIKNGCLAVGVGGELTKGAKKGDFDLVTETAKRFVQKVKEARS